MDADTNRLFSAVTESVGDQTTETERRLTDGNNFLWVYPDRMRGAVFTRFAPNGAPGRILAAVAEAFDTDIVSEHQPEYWGFETQEEWDEAEAKWAEAHDAEFYEEVMRYIRGEPHQIASGTNGEQWAENAKALILKNPDLGLPENQTDLLRRAREGTGIEVRLSEKDIAAAIMMMTHEDDLPKA